MSSDLDSLRAPRLHRWCHRADVSKPESLEFVPLMTCGLADISTTAADQFYMEFFRLMKPRSMVNAELKLAPKACALL